MINNRLFKVTTKVIIFDESNNILLLKNNPVSNSDMIWDLPGGTLEKGESIISCVKREIMEELSVSINDTELDFFKNFVVNRESKPDLLIIVYVLNKHVENISISDEHSEFNYLSNSSVKLLNEDTIIMEIIDEVYKSDKVK